MATVTKENLGFLHEKLTITLAKDDYLPAFEKALKDYSKKVNIPGFRKGMVPSGLVKKMYGTSAFTDEVLRSVDRELIKYLETEKLNILAQPIPLVADVHQINMNNPADYSFSFEIGLKPELAPTDLSKGKFIRYKVTVTDEMIDSEAERLQNRYGTMATAESINSEDIVLNVTFTESDAEGNEIEGGIKKDNSLLVKYFTEEVRSSLMGKTLDHSFVIQLKTAFEDKEREWIISDLGLNKDDKTAEEKYFKVAITKVGLLEKRELNEAFCNQLFPNQEVKTEEQFRSKIKDEIQAHWDAQARNQIHDQVYHELIDRTAISFPEAFLKKWIKTQSGPLTKAQGQKTDEQVEEEFPSYLKQLKWILLSDNIVKANQIVVNADEIRQFAKHQRFGYMGMGLKDAEQEWVKEYVERMMKDRKFIEDAYIRIQTQKMFEWAETQVNATEKEIGMEDFSKMLEEHLHH